MVWWLVWARVSVYMLHIESVTLIDELRGRLRCSSLLPQYLITAMLTGALTVTDWEHESLIFSVLQVISWNMAERWEFIIKGKEGVNINCSIALFLLRCKWSSKIISGRFQTFIILKLEIINLKDSYQYSGTYTSLWWTAIIAPYNKAHHNYAVYFKIVSNFLRPIVPKGEVSKLCKIFKFATILTQFCRKHDYWCDRRKLL